MIRGVALDHRESQLLLESRGALLELRNECLQIGVVACGVDRVLRRRLRPTRSTIRDSPFAVRSKTEACRPAHASPAIVAVTVARTKIPMSAPRAEPAAPTPRSCAPTTPRTASIDTETTPEATRVQADSCAPMPWRNEGGYQRFIDPDGYPCQQPPWGELTAINSSGDIAWRVPLGSYREVEEQGLKHAGAANMGGSIATAGGLVFIGATTDSKFRAFDSRTGEELWATTLDATADAVPMTYQGRNGKQYVVIAAGGTNRFRMLARTAEVTTSHEIVEG